MKAAVQGDKVCSFRAGEKKAEKASRTLPQPLRKSEELDGASRGGVF